MTATKERFKNKHFEQITSLFFAYWTLIDLYFCKTCFAWNYNVLLIWLLFHASRWKGRTGLLVQTILINIFVDGVNSDIPLTLGFIVFWCAIIKTLLVVYLLKINTLPALKTDAIGQCW